jgi:hypothetical protein
MEKYDSLQLHRVEAQLRRILKRASSETVHSPASSWNLTKALMLIYILECFLYFEVITFRQS